MGADGRHPDILPELPVAFSEISFMEALAFFDDEDFITFFGQAHGADGSAEAGADDDVIVKGFSVILIVMSIYPIIRVILS